MSNKNRRKKDRRENDRHRKERLLHCAKRLARASQLLNDEVDALFEAEGITRGEL